MDQEVLKIDPARKAEWVAALRSGNYNQIVGELQTDCGHCCLGVISELAANAGAIANCELSNNHFTYYSSGDGLEQTYSVLPRKVYEWLGLGPVEEMDDPDDADDWSDPTVLVTPDIQVRWMELKSNWVGVGMPTSLSALNDAGFTFNEIADVIEEQL